MCFLKGVIIANLGIIFVFPKGVTIAIFWTRLVSYEGCHYRIEYITQIVMARLGFEVALARLDFYSITLFRIVCVSAENFVLDSIVEFW